MSNDPTLKLMNSETALLADLADFNTKYANYIKCLNASGTSITNSQGAKCSLQDSNIQTVNDAYNKISQYTTINGTNTLTGGDTYGIVSAPLNSMPTTAQYDASFNYIKTTYNNDVLKLRGELDSKMRELYATPDSRIYEYKQSYDSTIYAGILWTILATTGLYFVFTKL